MKQINRITLILILLCSFVAFANSQNGPPQRTNFTATEILDPFGVQGNGPVGEFLDFGVLRCPGFGSPENPLEGCPAGSAFHWFGIRWLARLNSSDPRFNGDMTVEANLIWNAAGEGRTWARIHVDVDNGGTWDGQCQGSRTAAVDHFVETLRCTAQGEGGIVDGQHTSFTNTIPQYPSPVINFVGYIEGIVFDPH